MKKISLLVFMMIISSCADSITFMSYNIRNCKGMDDSCDIKRVAAVIENSNAEYIAIQEVDSMTCRSGNTYILGELSEILGMHCTFAPAIEYDGGKYGVGILSKEIPIDYRVYGLPGQEEERVLLIVEFQKMYICTTHFSLTEGDRKKSAEIVLDLINKLDKPLLFAGDLNALPESEEISIIRDNMIPVVSGDKTYPADSPSESIDHIFGLGIIPVESKIIEEKVASDHRPVWAKITL